MPNLVKILRDDDGFVVDDPVFHLSDPFPQGVWGRVFCTEEVFGIGESCVVYELRETKRGGIECDECRRKLRAYKAVRL